jgi:Ca2+-binding EF-hand superfamily protein
MPINPELITKLNALEDNIRADTKTKTLRTALWQSLDFNGNGIVSLAEIDKWVVERYPLLNSKPALMRAYKKTTLKDGDGDAWVERKEFIKLLRNLFYFNRVFIVFDNIDTDDDRRIDLEEFKTGFEVLNLDADAEKVFTEIDRNGGGFILFNEFCSWFAKNMNVEELLADELNDVELN